MHRLSHVPFLFALALRAGPCTSSRLTEGASVVGAIGTAAPFLCVAIDAIDPAASSVCGPTAQGAQAVAAAISAALTAAAAKATSSSPAPIARAARATAPVSRVAFACHGHVVTLSEPDAATVRASGVCAAPLPDAGAR